MSMFVSMFRGRYCNLHPLAYNQGTKPAADPPLCVPGWWLQHNYGKPPVSALRPLTPAT
jgi:hypothetical protein